MRRVRLCHRTRLQLYVKGLCFVGVDALLVGAYGSSMRAPFWIAIPAEEDLFEGLPEHLVEYRVKYWIY